MNNFQDSSSPSQRPKAKISWLKRIALAIPLGFCITCVWGPCNQEALQRFEYAFDDGVSPPLRVKFGTEHDVLLAPLLGRVYLPKGESTSYEYTFKGKKVSGTIPAVEAGEWYMTIRPDGISVYQ